MSLFGFGNVCENSHIVGFAKLGIYVEGEFFFFTKVGERLGFGRGKGLQSCSEEERCDHIRREASCHSQGFIGLQPECLCYADLAGKCFLMSSMAIGCPAQK